MFKTTAYALAAALTTATMASANSYIVDFDSIEEGVSTVELNTVTSEFDGVVEIYNYHGGELGQLLGSEAVIAGANSDVRVQLDRSTDLDMIAVLKVNGQIVATEKLDVEDS